MDIRAALLSTGDEKKINLNQTLGSNIIFKFPHNSSQTLSLRLRIMVSPKPNFSLFENACIIYFLCFLSVFRRLTIMMYLQNHATEIADVLYMAV